MSDKWKEYLQKTKVKSPNKLLQEAMLFVHKKFDALDLGAGSMNDVRFIVESGFNHIDAVDNNPEVLEIGKNLRAGNVDIHISNFDEFKFKENTYDLVNAQFSLPFNHPETFDEVFEKIKKALSLNGILAVTFLGKNDEWASNPKMTFLSAQEIRGMLDDLNIIKFEEIEHIAPTALGHLKQWHVIGIIAQKIK